MDVVRRIEAVEKDHNDKPKSAVIIAGCGQLSGAKPLA
jgi:hypothetical protein